MSVYYDFDEVDVFTVGAIGEPGQRTFLLQARRGAERVTVKCEKQQAAAIADYLRKVLNDLPPPADVPVSDALRLATPVEPAFVLGPIGLGYERSTDRVLIQLDELVPADLEDDDEEGDAGTAGGDVGPLDEIEDRGRVRMLLTRGQVQAFCDQAAALVAAGRPACRWCGQPMNPSGHPCPRMN